MQAPNVVAHATLDTCACLSCGTLTGPYVDTLVDVPVHGRVYVCVHNCVSVWADMLGYADPVSVEAMHANALSLTERLTAADEQVEQLGEALVSARPNVVSIDTVRVLLKKGTSTTPSAA